MKKRKSIIILFAIMLLLSLAGCTATQSDDVAENNTDETKFRTVINDVLSGELTYEEFFGLTDELTAEEAEQLFEDLYNQLGAEEFSSFLERLDYAASILFPLTDEEIEAQRIRTEERRRVNVQYIIRGDFTPAADDIDLQTIARVVFVDNIGMEGNGFVLDRTYGRVYYDPITASVEMLEFILFSAEFEDEDLTRFIQVIEKSGLRDWEEHYDGIIDEYAEGGRRSWMIGIKFSDGTMLRRSGSGMDWTNVASSPDQLAILTDFIATIGAEVQLRHEAEANLNG